MTLAVGACVYLDAGNDLMSDPPLSGVVDTVNGVAPEVVRVAFENGQPSSSRAPMKPPSGS